MFPCLLVSTLTLAASEECTQPRVAITDAAGVAEAISAQGWVILTNLTNGDESPRWDQVTLGLAERVFPGRLRSSGANTLSAVHEENGAVQEQYRQRCKADPNCLAKDNEPDSFTPMGNSLLPHTDGYIYGDYMPDMVFLLLEAQSDNGGENFLVDGEAVLRRLGSNATNSLHVQLAHTATVDLTERLSSGGVTTGREAFGPVFRRRDDGTLWWRRQIQTTAYERAQQVEKQQEARGDDDDEAEHEGVQPYQSLWQPTDADEEAAAATRAMLHAVDSAVQEETMAAERFHLRSGEALLIDNLRILHGREAYSSKSLRNERKMWRVWAWTDRTAGLPDGMKEIGSPVHASKLL